MKSTAQLARDPQAHLPTGPTHVASRSARTAAPGAWTPTDRWAWPCGLPVSGIARAVAGCIARHANDKTGLGWPGMGRIVNETGFCRTAVVKAIKELERGGHVTVGRFKVGKKNTVNRYQLPPMGGAPGGLVGGGCSALDALPSAPDALGGSALDGPESVSIKSVKKSTSAARARCSICKRTWPANRGTECYRCGPESSTRLPADDTPAAEPTACTCGDAYRNSYGRWCIDCDGEASAAQRDAVRPSPGPSVSKEHAIAEIETRPTPETRGQSPDNLVPAGDEVTPDGGEAGPNETQFYQQLSKWRVKGATHDKYTESIGEHGSEAQGRGAD